MPSLPWAHLTLFKTVILCYDEGVYKMNTFHLIYCLSRDRKTAYNAVKGRKPMLRMGIALFLTLAFAAYICFFAEKQSAQPRRTFSALLAAVAELDGARAPHFILQPIVENSLLHGLKNKGCRGGGTISAHKTPEGHMETCARDTGSGFAEEKKAAVDEMPRDCAKQAPPAHRQQHRHPQCAEADQAFVQPDIWTLVYGT